MKELNNYEQYIILIIIKYIINIIKNE